MVSSTPRPHFTPRKDLVPILQEAGWAPGPVWTNIQHAVYNKILHIIYYTIYIIYIIPGARGGAVC